VQTLLIIIIGSIIVLASNEFLSHYFVRASQTLQHWQQRDHVALAASYIMASQTQHIHACTQAEPQFHADVPIASRLAATIWTRSTAASHGLPVNNSGAGELVGDDVLITQALTPGVWLPWVNAGQVQLALFKSIGVTSGDSVVITDCQRTEVIKVDKVSSRLPERITLASPVVHEFNDGASILPLKTRVWYLGQRSQADTYALYVMDQRLRRHEILPGLTGLTLQSNGSAITATVQADKVQEQLCLSNTDLF
jgi:hypothetical protein